MKLLLKFSFFKMENFSQKIWKEETTWDMKL
jgi:hypothetical protein